jgi:hypothetical protein
LGGPETGRPTCFNRPTTAFLMDETRNHIPV